MRATLVLNVLTKQPVCCSVPTSHMKSFYTTDFPTTSKLCLFVADKVRFCSENKATVKETDYCQG